MNLPPKARPWTPGSTVVFFTVWGRIFGKKAWIVACGQLAAPWWQCTLSPNSRNAWVSRPQQHYRTSAAALLARFGPLRLLPLPEDEAVAKGSSLLHSGGDPAGIAKCSWYASRAGLPAHVPAVATALGSMCRCTSGLFWGRRCPNLNQVNTLVSMGPVSELLIHPCMFLFHKLS